MIGRSAIAGKTSFCTNLIILLFHLISMHTLKKKHHTIKTEGQRNGAFILNDYRGL